MPLNLEKIRRLMGDGTQVEVAKRAGMSQPHFARILAGKLDPRLSTVERLAAAIRCKVKDIVR